MNENMNLIPKIEEIVCKVFNITLEDLRGNLPFFKLISYECNK